MPDKRTDLLVLQDVRVTEVRFADGARVEMWISPAASNDGATTALVDAVAQAVAQLPARMRETLSHIVIHAGEETSFAEDQGRFFVLYTGTIARRIAAGDLQETVFHEAVHATLDVPFASDSAWRAAQAQDGAFITRYAERWPQREDLAESALFGWTVLAQPGRLPADIERQVRLLMPARLKVLEAIYAGDIDIVPPAVRPEC